MMKKDTKKNNSRKKLLVLGSVPPRYDSKYFNDFEFWKDNHLLVFAESNSKINKNKQINKLFGNPFNITKYCCLHTSKRTSKVYSVYYQDHFYPKSYSKLKEIDDENLQMVINKGILKSCSLEFNVYIYQYKDSLFWFIGYDLQDNTEIIFHLQTNNPFLLPSNRKIHKFDNRGFMSNSNYKIGEVGSFRIYKQVIPDSYPISEVRVGLSGTNMIAWFKSFQISNFDRF